MKVTEIPADIHIPAPETPRSVGVHVSNIIRCIATQQGILKKEWAEELSLVDARDINELDITARLRISLGLAWEAHYLPLLDGVVDHPGEMQVDGIFMTHDGESVDVIITDRGKNNAVLVLHECKCTWKSTRTVGDMTEQWMWLAQIKAYCKGLGTLFAKMHVLFVCGDYSYPIRPLLKCWLIEFTQEEIDDNWSLLRDYRDHRLALEAGQ